MRTGTLNMTVFLKRLVSHHLWLWALAIALTACAQGDSQRGTAVYMLLDTSGTYREELSKANSIINYLLGTLEVGDSLAIARIDSGSFSEKDIEIKATFDSRPSVANRQKRAFRRKTDEFFKSLEPAAHTDIKGAMLQASQFLDETGAGNQYILIFSDLKEDLPEGYKRDFVVPLDNIEVVALNVTKLREDNINPQGYLDRLEAWEKRVESSGGDWRVMNDLNRLERLLGHY